MTNKEYLQSLSAGMLAVWLGWRLDCKSCPVKDGCEARKNSDPIPVCNGCQPRLFDWLQSEKKEEGRLE